jgi:phosphatidylglycerophosphatase A
MLKAKARRNAPQPKPVNFWSPASLIATLFGTGYMPTAPGTWGSALALPLGWALNYYFNPWGVPVAIVVVFFVGWWASSAYTRAAGVEDPGAVVIDEVVGQWIVMISAPPTIIGYGAAFLLFRLFDVLKPFPINWLDRHVKGGFGIMLDDVLAGIYAFAILYALVYLHVLKLPHVVL